MGKILLFVLFSLHLVAADVEGVETLAEKQIKKLTLTSESSESLLSGACQFGVVDVSRSRVVAENFAQFCRGSKNEISSFLGREKLGTVVVLGIGYANDIPLKQLIEQSSNLILIDGNLEPIKQILKSREFVGLDQSQVRLIQRDLTGGYYELLKTRFVELESLLKESFENAISTRQANLTDLVDFLKLELRSNLAEFEPNVIISSLVTSQLYPLTTPIEKLLRANLIDQFKDNAIFFKKFLNAVDMFERRAIERAYYEGLRLSGAQAIYFADTNWELLDQEALNEFLAGMEPRYNSAKRKDVWRYREDAPVSWVKFHQDTICAACGTPKPTKRCPCKASSYCDVACQRMHWPEHKSACPMAKK